MEFLLVVFGVLGMLLGFIAVANSKKGSVLGIIILFFCFALLVTSIFTGIIQIEMPNISTLNFFTKATPERTVDNMLKAVIKSDFETVRSYIKLNSYDDAFIYDDDETLLIENLFKKLDYEILSCEKSSDFATVKTKISNIDMELVFSEVMLTLPNIFVGEISTELQMQKEMISHVNELLNKTDVKYKTEIVDIKLVKVNGKWFVQPEEFNMNLWNAITGGLMYMVD